MCVSEHCVLCAVLQLLNAIQLFGANLDDYLHLLLPPIVKLFDAPDVPLQARKSVPPTGCFILSQLEFRRLNHAGLCRRLLSSQLLMLHWELSHERDAWEEMFLSKFLLMLWTIQLVNECFVPCGFSLLWRRVALETLDRLTESLDFTDYASRIIHPIVRTLDSTPELRSTSMDTLSSLVFQLGKKVTTCCPRACL